MNPTYLLLILTLVSACSLQPQPTETINSWQQQQRVAKLQDWTLSGKLGFRAPQQGGSAALNWIQKKDNYQLFLSGPFGVGSAKIYGNDDSAEMLYRDKLYRQAPQQLAMQLTGLPLPVGALSWWARGLPSPTQSAATDVTTGADGLASGFDQAGWQLSFSRYQQTDGLILPGKIIGTFASSESINNQTTSNKNSAREDRSYSFKLVISAWKLPKEE